MSLQHIFSSFKKHAQPKKIWKWLKAHRVGTWLFRAAAIGFLCVTFLFVYYSFTLPDPNKLLARSVPESTKIFDRDGKVLYEIHGEAKRTLVGLDQITDDVKHATIAIEDKDFYKHGGISPRGILRSVFVDIFYGKSHGGSTITQQFVKNAVLTSEKRLSRKMKEWILSLEIDARFSKDEILKLYLNEIPYGRNAYGIEAAAQTYFGKSAKDLTLAESAYLAALPQAPTYYNPSGPHRDALDARRKHVLTAMKEQGYIDEAQYTAALEEKVTFSAIKNSITAPHFVLYVQDYLAAKYGEKTLQEGGLKVYTTLDSKLQAAAEEAVKVGAEKNAKKYGANNAALVAIDPKTGQILAMVGSKDYFGDAQPAGCHPGKDCTFEPNVNVSVTPQQPGSSFKPYAYVTAFTKEFKYAPASMLFDVTTNFGTFGGQSYIPHNYNGANYGPVSMRQALAGSLNIPAVKTLALVGVDKVTETAKSLGITSPLQDCGLSLVLGGCEVKLVDHVASYATLANLGEKHTKTALLKVEDREGKVLEEYKDDTEQVIDPQAVYELIDIMTDNQARSYIFGGSSPLAFPGREVACKTGTTNQWRDGWTLCFTPTIAVGTWAGNNNNTVMKPGADGVLVAAPITRAVIEAALKDRPAENFKVPSGIQRVTVDSVSGKLPTEYSPSTKTEVFADYSVPKEYDNVHVAVKIDRETGLPATELTTPDHIDLKLYTIFHSERPDNPAWENPVVAWAKSQGYEYPTDTAQQGQPSGEAGDGPTVGIVEPGDGATITSTPFQVMVAASSDAGIARVDLLLDGQVVQSLTSAPYTFTVTKKISAGLHTLAAHAVDKDAKAADTTVTITYADGVPLTIIEPGDGDSMQSPVTLSARSSQNFSTLLFYSQSGKLASPIGVADKETGPAGYEYTLTWKPSKTGTYTVFAKSGSGETSQKITFTVSKN